MLFLKEGLGIEKYLFKEIERVAFPISANYFHILLYFSWQMSRAVVLKAASFTRSTLRALSLQSQLASRPTVEFAGLFTVVELS